MTGLPEALAALAAYPQFVLYRKADKLPCDPATGAVCDVQDSRSHTDAATAYAQAARFGAAYGVGFVLRADDPFVVFDADKALLPSGQWSPESLELVAALPGAAVEVSVSGRGLHIWATAAAVPPHGCKNLAARFEMYHEGRYIALGGHPGTTGNAAKDVTALLPGIVARWFPPSVAAPSQRATGERMAEWRGPEDDEELIRRMLASKQSAASVFGGKADVRSLWIADADVLARSFPPTGDGAAYDASSADAALAVHLAWWTGNDEPRIERIMRASGLARDKYDRPDYLPRTIAGAMALNHGCYVETPADHTPTSAPATEQPQQATVRDVTGHGFCMAEDQRKLWEGCVYVAGVNKILLPNGEYRDEKTWNNWHSRLTFSDGGDKTLKAWDAFQGSQALAWPKVDRVDFRPDLLPRAVFQEDGVSFVNTYRPLGIKPVPGDTSLFTDHLARLFPDAGDRAIVLDYMASLVQRKGVKASWAPFIQGTKGNGKSLLAYCVAHAVGHPYTQPITPALLASEFNEWLCRSVFAYVEDTYVPTGRGKAEIMEILKPMVTAERQPIRAMRTDTTVRRVCCNFLFFSNHEDGLPQDDDERRYAPLFCAQREKAHLARDGMGAAYFSRLYGWLENGGYANVAHLLATHPIPAHHGVEWLRGRAPDTTSTQAAVRASASSIEMEVLEAIAAGREGFRGGWVSSVALDALVKETRTALPRTRRRALLQKLGYDWHPGLHEGRSTRHLSNGGAKAVLFVKAGHESCKLGSATAIVDAFEAAQTVPMFQVVGGRAA